MNTSLETLSYKISEGIQSSDPGYLKQQLNLFHRNVVNYQSSDISFINGLLATGLRGSVAIDGNKLVDNYYQFAEASRLHLPLVVNTNARTKSGRSNYHHISAIRETGCFQLIATSKLEEIYLTLIAHKIAELSLIPGIVIADYGISKSDIRLPDDNLIIKYLGSPDDHISCPTPSQEIIFGKTRRRIPNWYNFDLPALLGSNKNGKEQAFEYAANKKYFIDHLDSIINHSFNEFNELMELDLSPIASGNNSSKNICVSIGGQLQEVTEKAIKGLKNVQWIQINQLNPFPRRALNKLLQNKDKVTILFNSSSQSFISEEINKILATTKAKIYTARYQPDISVSTLEMAINHMANHQSVKEYFIDIPFVNDSSLFPKHEVLIQEIEKQYPEISNEFISSEISSTKPNLPDATEIPYTVRMYMDRGPEFSKLSRFYNNTGFFYQTKNFQQLIADPFSALPLIPAAAANFFSPEDRTQLPIFNPSRCTGCGNCYIYCPHSALPPIVIGVEQIMQTGAELASTKGKSISRLYPMMKNIAKLAGKIINEKEVNNVSDFLPEAFESLVSQMKLEGEKQKTAKEEFEAVFQEIKTFPFAATKTYFSDPNDIEKGNGELFSVSIDTGSCTGCSICSQVCNDEALEMKIVDNESLNNAKSNHYLWERFPDTKGSTIDRTYRLEDHKSLAAILLSRNYYKTISGVSWSEGDNPDKTLVHLVACVTEAIVQPRIVTQIKKIENLIGTLSENVHKYLSDAIPDKNLESISNSLKQARRKKIRIKDVIDNIHPEEQTSFIDAEELQRKTNLAKDLTYLKEQLSEGPTGIGRSRYGLVIGGERALKFSDSYPYNNFTSPCIIHRKGSSQLITIGLFYGHLRYLLDNIKLIRRAELESKNKYDPSVHDLQISELTWDQLTVEEKRMVPPILLFSEIGDLQEDIDHLLTLNLPIKVIFLDHSSPKINDTQGSLYKAKNNLLRYITMKNAFVFQGGMSDIDRLLDGLMDGLERTYPAVFNLYSVGCTDHDITDGDWAPFAMLAKDSRAFPDIKYDIGDTSTLLNSSLSLKGNRDIKDDWVKDKIELPSGEFSNYKISWADWAFTLLNWKDQFVLTEKDNNHLFVPDYIALNTNSREGKIPVIMRMSGDQIKYYEVSNNVVSMTERVLSFWNTLREMAGHLTEFPDKLKKEVTKEISDRFEEEKAKLEADLRKQVAEIEASQTEILRQKLKEKLISLSRMNQNKTKV